jgi:hypothetical protein
LVSTWWLIRRVWSRFPTRLAPTTILGSMLLLSLGVFSFSGEDRSRPAPDQTKLVRLALRLPKNSFTPGEAIPLHVEYINDSHRTVTIWDCGFSLNHFIEVTDEQGLSPPLTERGTSARRNFSPGGERDHNYPMRLAPGTRRLHSPKPHLNLIYRLPAGAYRVRVTYEERMPDRPREREVHRRLVSPWVDSRIAPNDRR